jgi:hypothetical protein
MKHKKRTAIKRNAKVIDSIPAEVLNPLLNISTLLPVLARQLIYV